MKKSRIVISYFGAGLDDMPRKQQADPAAVLRVLQEAKRFSVFEATANQVIAKTIDRLSKNEHFIVTGGAYPWTTIELTDSGRALIEGIKP